MLLLHDHDHDHREWKYSLQGALASCRVYHLVRAGGGGGFNKFS